MSANERGFRQQPPRRQCSFFAAGSCKLGDKCRFAHDVLKPCRFYPGCKYGSRCRFSHAASAGRSEVETHPQSSCSFSLVRFLAVLDFEATCWSDDREKQRREAEIIEFPTVLFRIGEEGTLERVGEWRQFVRPTINPALSDFCIQMTAITQDEVDSAAPIAQVLAQHTSWLSCATGNAPDEAVLFVTCGDWDLGTCLPLEERNKGLVVPLVYTRWANLKVEFLKVFPCQGRPDMTGMLELAGLELEGHHHSGLDDSRNIGRVLESVWQRGHRVADYEERRVVRR